MTNRIAYANGNLLWRNVINEGCNASYEGALAAVELIWRRMNRENTPYEEINPWAPSAAQVDTLIVTFSQKKAEADNSSIEISIYLSRIASTVNPEQRGEQIASSLQQYLDAQAAFQEAREKWRGPQDGNRPNGPPMSGELLSAIQNWGFAALPTLKEHMNHPAALEIVPAAISRVTMSQWIAARKGVISTLSGIIAEGQHRHPNEICRRIAESRKGHGWDILLKAYELFGGKELDIDQFSHALTRALQPQNMTSLVTQIENGRFFEWFKANSHIGGIADAIALQVRANSGDEKLVKASFRRVGTAAADYFEYELLKALGDNDEILAFGLAAVDAGRANKTSSSAFRALLSLSKSEEYVTAQVRNIHPASCNALRKALLERAQAVGPATIAARQILARIEATRREGGRPNDEPRHPAPEEGNTWTAALLHPELT